MALTPEWHDSGEPPALGRRRNRAAKPMTASYNTRVRSDNSVSQRDALIDDPLIYRAVQLAQQYDDVNRVPDLGTTLSDFPESIIESLQWQPRTAVEYRLDGNISLKPRWSRGITVPSAGVN
jgi:hypothetical protein